VSAVPVNVWTVLLIIQLIAITIIDWKWQIIPNYLNSMVAFTGLAHAYDGAWKSIFSPVIASVFVMFMFWALKVVYSKTRNQDGIGWGDVKFLGAATTWVGLTGLPWVVLVGAISGLAFAIVSSSLGRPLGLAHRLAFGPHLALGLFFAWVFRDTLALGV
jgi:leader peptidase (prepilin peptidase) / N-methyltransferase